MKWKLFEIKFRFFFCCVDDRAAAIPHRPCLLCQFVDYSEYICDCVRIFRLLYYPFAIFCQPSPPSHPPKLLFSSSFALALLFYFLLSFNIVIFICIVNEIHFIQLLFFRTHIHSCAIVSYFRLIIHTNGILLGIAMAVASLSRPFPICMWCAWWCVLCANHVSISCSHSRYSRGDDGGGPQKEVWRRHEKKIIFMGMFLK